MKLIKFTALLILFYQSPVLTQIWNILPLADTSEARYEDMYFINASTGIIVNYDGTVIKTTNGGMNWLTLNNDLNNLLRSVGMFDINTAIIGTLDTGKILFRTTNGGVNWTNVSANVTGTKPKGICGISIVNTTTAFATGRYYCPANLIKTTNAGLNWVSIPVDTSMARSLIDCHFWSPDSGFVVGGYSPTNNFLTGRSVVLFTSNGGTTWQQVYRSTRTSEWSWKIQFVNRQLGYTSIEKMGTPTFILKTTNGGINWIEINLPNTITDLEGIGFLNEQTGWVGGWGSNNNMPCYRTTNGGANWHLAGWGLNVNRFRFINDTTAYAVGKSVYKLNYSTVGIQQLSGEIPSRHILHQNYPNPFNPATKIKFEVPNNSFVTVKVFDALGSEIETLANENINAGSYEVNWDASAYPSGVYFYTIIAGGFSQSKKMLVVK
jgi:photosystem II stability/assembly factor-like uncharacterized protein